MNISWGIFSKYKTELYGFAILWIMLFHGIILRSTALPPQLAFLKKFLENGNCGVEIFLFLSGICLFFSMKKNDSTADFLKKRLCRIFFPVIIIDGFYWAYICILQKHNILLFLKKITVLEFWLNGNQQVWFVALIVPLYFLFPLVYKRVLSITDEKKRWFVIIILCIAVYVVAFLIYFNSFKFYKMIEIAFTRIPVFLLGCGCGYLVYENRPINKIIVFLSFVGVIFGFYYFYFKPFPLVYYARLPYLVIGPCFALWLCVLLDKLKALSINKILMLFGEVSLELYLAHILFRQFANFMQLYGSNSVYNYYKYILFAVLSSYTVSKIVHILFNQAFKKQS